MGRRAATLLLSGLGVAAGAFSLAAARDDPDFWFAGASAAGAVALLGAGWALVGCSLVLSLRSPHGRLGPLLAAAGFAWLLLEWNNPGIGSSVAFTIGLALYAACPPLVAHAVLAFPRGRLLTHLERGTLAVAYATNVLALGVLPALVFDPQAQGCSQCPRNGLLVTGNAEAFEQLNRAGVRLGVVWSLALGALVVWKLVRASRAARRATWVVLGGGAVYLGLVGAWFAASLDRGFLWNGTLERRLWLGQAAALLGIVLGVGWSRLRARRARSAVAGLVVELAQSPPAGRLRDALAGIVGDPGLVLAYPLGDSGRLVDADGGPVELPERLERTSLVRGGRAVAVLAHRPGLLDDEQLVDEVTAASRLALDNERLQAQVRARLEELRSSRARIVDAGDAERRRLERDLHDGAQQRLVGLSLSVRLLRSRLPPGGEATGAARLEQAEAELRSAVAELRELAHGIFPAVLADEGLAAAVEALAEDAPVPIRIRDLPDGRFDGPVETAAYTVVAEAAMAATSTLTVHAERANGALVVEVETRDCPLDLVALEDRVGALDGRLGVERGENGITIRAELPCGS